MGRLGSQGIKEKKVDLRNSEQTFEGVFFQFFVVKKMFKTFVGSALKSYLV